MGGWHDTGLVMYLNSGYAEEPAARVWAVVGVAAPVMSVIVIGFVGALVVLVLCGTPPAEGDLSMAGLLLVTKLLPCGDPCWTKADV